MEDFTVSGVFRPAPLFNIFCLPPREIWDWVNSMSELRESKPEWRVKQNVTAKKVHLVQKLASEKNKNKKTIKNKETFFGKSASSCDPGQPSWLGSRDFASPYVFMWEVRLAVKLVYDGIALRFSLSNLNYCKRESAPRSVNTNEFSTPLYRWA